MASEKTSVEIGFDGGQVIPARLTGDQGEVVAEGDRLRRQPP